VETAESVIVLHVSRVRLYRDLVPFWKTLDFNLNTQIGILCEISQPTEISPLFIIKWTMMVMQKKLIFLFSESFQFAHGISVMLSLDHIDLLGEDG
jgi:hypothetical protein